MNRRQQERFIAEMNTRIATSIQEHMNVPQPVPHVNDLWSGIVALVRSSALDGKVGFNDITVGVGLSVAGFAIGGIGALCFSLTGTPWAESGTFWEHCTRAGCYLGIVRLSLDALAVPVMWSEFLDWTHDTIVASVEAWRGGVDEEEDEPEPTNTRALPINHVGGTVYTDMPEVSQFEHNTRTIPSCNTQSGERTISTDKLCSYLKFITNIGERRKDHRPDYINQKEWPDVRDWLTSQGWWDLPRHSPTLRHACAKIRGTVMNRNERNGTNGGTG